MSVFVEPIKLQLPCRATRIYSCVKKNRKFWGFTSSRTWGDQSANSQKPSWTFGSHVTEPDLYRENEMENGARAGAFGAKMVYSMRTTIQKADFTKRHHAPENLCRMF